MPCGGSILVVVESGGAEREIEVHNDRLKAQVATDRPRDIVRDGRSPDATLGADYGYDAAYRLGIGCGKQVADRPHDVDGANGRHQIFADPAARQLAIKPDVVDAAKHDHPRTGIADLRQLIETLENVVGSTVGFYGTLRSRP
jgi:hypothetical protein